MMESADKVEKKKPEAKLKGWERTWMGVVDYTAPYSPLV